MKKISVFTIFVFSSIIAKSQFVENTSGILTTSDNVEIVSAIGGDQVKLQISNTDLSGYSVIRFGDNSSGNGKAYLHRFNSNWTSSTLMWQTNSVGFYESVGSMNIGGAASFKIFTGNENSERFRIDNLGNVGIGTINSDGRLSVSGSSGGEVKLHISNTSQNGYSVIRFSDIETGSGKAYLHRFNSNWTSSTLMWQANSIGFYESVGSMNIGGATSFKIFTGNENSERLRINDLGNVGIGTTNLDPNFKLSVNGAIRSKEVRVEAGWSDFVFYDNYELRTLEEVEQHINENGHLPEIPSEAEVTENGINLGEMDAKLLQKIEELTLYMIDMNKQLKSQKERVEQLENQNTELKNKIQLLENQ